uniref:Uncharacterized protein n=1 Tax=viral metagenome TaxID=1070528 RepID=A0A2V0RBP1_9ZZZZ
MKTLTGSGGRRRRKRSKAGRQQRAVVRDRTHLPKKKKGRETAADRAAGKRSSCVEDVGQEHQPCHGSFRKGTVAAGERKAASRRGSPDRKPRRRTTEAPISGE